MVNQIVANGVTIGKNGHITIYLNGTKLREFLTPHKGVFIKYKQDNSEDNLLMNEGGKVISWPSDNKEECAIYIAKRCHMKYYGKEAH